MAYEPWTTKEFQDLGVFCRNYYHTPDPAAFQNRSSFREDLVVTKVAERMRQASDSYRVLDVCCGKGVLARRMIGALGENARRVEYCCVDRKSECIDFIKSNGADFRDFCSFSCKVRDVEDLSGLDERSFDLIVVMNALHELSASVFPQIFAGLNAVLSQQNGLLYIVDMERLSSERAESDAITWLGDEVAELLKGGGFEPNVTVHQKGDEGAPVNVFCAVVGAVDQVNEARIGEVVKDLLRRKLEEAIRERSAARFNEGTEWGRIQNWLVAGGLVCRCVEELRKLEELKLRADEE